MFYTLAIILFVGLHFTNPAPTAGPPPPQWALAWTGIGSGHSLVNNRTISFQIFYDWTQRAEVLNLMREDAYSYTIMHNGTSVWRLDRSNRTCCLDPNNSGITPLRPDWLQTDNNTVYDGIVTIMEHECYSWTRHIPDTATFTWFASVLTGFPCGLAWPNVMQANIAYYSEDRNLFPPTIFQVPDYCPREVTDPNCDVMHI